MKRIIFVFVVLFLFISCKREQFLYQDTSPRIWLGGLSRFKSTFLSVDSIESSFRLLPTSQREDTLFLQANVTGLPSSVSRKFLLEVVQEESNVPVSAYEIKETVIPANSLSTEIPVIIKKNVDGLDLSKVKAVLKVRCLPNENFLIALPGTDEFRFFWSDFLPEPPQWSLLRSILGPFSQARYKFILDYDKDINLDRYVGNINLQLGLQSTLRKVLTDYNADPLNAGRAEGWPYLDDNGQPLTF